MKLVRRLLVAVALFYAAYAGFLGYSDYIKVEGVVRDALGRQPEGRWVDRAHAVREAVLNNARDAGVPLEEKDVVVTEADRLLRVRVGWSHAMLIVRGEIVLALPVWLERSAPVSAQ